MNKKKVAIFNYDNGRGGAADSFRRISTNFCTESFVVTRFIAFQAEEPNHVLNMFRKRSILLKILDKGLKIIGLDAYKFPNIPTLKAIRLLKSQDAIILFNLHGGSMSIFDILWFKLAKKSTVILRTSDIYWVTGRCAFPSFCDEYTNNCKSCGFLREYPEGKRRKLSSDLKIKRWLFNQVVSVVATPSSWIADTYRKQYPNKHYVHVRNSYTPLQRLYKQTILPQASNNDLTIIFCASHLADRRKGFDLFANMINSNPKFCSKYNFIVIGEYQKDFQDKHALLFPKSNMHFVGHCTKQQIESYYNLGDIYLHLSYADNFPNSVLLAHHTGLPLICIDVGGVAELMLQYQAGSKIDLNSVEEMQAQLIDKIRHVTEYLPSYKRRAKKLQQDLPKHCNETHVLEQLILEPKK